MYHSDTPPEPNVSPQLAALTHSLSVSGFLTMTGPEPLGRAGETRGTPVTRLPSGETARGAHANAPRPRPLPAPRRRRCQRVHARPARRSRFSTRVPDAGSPASARPRPQPHQPSPLTGALVRAPRPPGCRRPPRGAPPPRPPRKPRPRPRRPPPSPPPPLASAAAAPARSPPGRSRPGRRPWPPRAARCACIWLPPAVPNEREPGRGGDALAPPETGLHGGAASAGCGAGMEGGGGAAPGPGAGGRGGARARGSLGLQVRDRLGGGGQECVWGRDRCNVKGQVIEHEQFV